MNDLRYLIQVRPYVQHTGRDFVLWIQILGYENDQRSYPEKTTDDP